MKIYAFSGLGTDGRIFRQLKLEHEIEAVKWVEPRSDDTLASYALRLGQQVDQSEPFALMGVSFGGMLVSELAKTMKPEKVILISSAANKHELPNIAGLERRFGLVKKIPISWFRPPRWTAYLNFPFNKSHRQIALGIIRDIDREFVKWALPIISNWNNEESPKNMLRIHGRLDPIVPLKKRMNAVVIGRGHFIVLKKADEMSQIINYNLRNLNSTT